jgi:hypothetical protein
MDERRRTGAGRTWCAAFACLVLVALPACHLAPPAPGSTLIGCDHAATRNLVTSSAHLDPDCTYTGGFDLGTSGTTLDCQGATIRSPEGAGGVGIQISAPVGSDLHDVTVRNCHVEGFLNSLRVTRPGFRDLPVGGEYLDDLHGIVIEDSSFTGSHGVGVYVDGYVTGVTIEGNRIQNTGSSGIYLETGSRGSTVVDNALLDDGFIENGPGGQPFSFSGLSLWFWGVGREGISVDGSYDNTIRGNLFIGNSNGGVLLYKNCGEYPDRTRYFERRYPSNGNLIEQNTFIGGRNGVWVGSRMAENTLPMDCTDPAYIDEPGRRVVLDHAADNVIRQNSFIDVTYGVRVEDDGNQVIDNHFTASSPDHHAVIVGTPFRNDVLGEPVTGTVLRGNVSDIVGNTDPYRWIDGTTDTTDSGNTALGAPSSICPGVEPPRSTFIFVIAIAVAGPGGTAPATTPDLTVPVLGALPPCSD